MNRRMLTITSVVVLCTLALCISLTGQKVSAQDVSALSTPVYNPYPPGILPPDLNSEIKRVLREIDFIESRAIQRWHSLPPPSRLPPRPGPNPADCRQLLARGEFLSHPARPT